MSFGRYLFCCSLAAIFYHSYYIFSTIFSQVSNNEDLSFNILDHQHLNTGINQESKQTTKISKQGSKQTTKIRTKSNSRHKTSKSTSKPKPKKVRNYPMALSCNNLFDDCIPMERTKNKRPKKNNKKYDDLYDNRLYIPNGDGDDDSDGDDDGNCEPIHEWVKNEYSYLLCNPLHEIDLLTGAKNGTVQYLASGGDRSVWEIKDSDIHNNDSYLALKTKKQGRPFVDDDYDSAWQDGMVMAEMSSSPYVLTSYGMCGLSQVLELADGGALDDLVSRERSKALPTNVRTSSIDKLKILIQMSTAIADLHDHSIAHVDLDICQYVLVDGVYKLNDFHLSNILQRNTETNEMCSSIPQLAQRWWFLRAPEERQHVETDNKKSDVYMLGNSMYNVATGLWLFEHTQLHQKFEMITTAIRNHVRPPFPKHLKNSNDKAVKAMIKGITMSWEHDEKKRPTARKISNYFIEQLQKIESEKKYENKNKRKMKKHANGQNNDGIVRVDIKADPENFEYPEETYFDSIG